MDPQQATVYSADIVPGHVVDTKPSVGEHVAKGAEVQLLVSKGAEPYPLPKLVGQPQATAEELVKTHWKLGTQIDQFDAKIPKGTVIDALNDAKPPVSLSTATTYEDQRTVTLVVSAGAIPNVSGKTQADAKAALEAAGLHVSGTVTEFSSTVKKDLAIGVVTVGTDKKPLTIQKGDDVTLRVSKGPELVAVPNVIGMTWDVAKQKLTDRRVQTELLPWRRYGPVCVHRPIGLAARVRRNPREAR